VSAPDDLRAQLQEIYDLGYAHGRARERRFLLKAAKFLVFTGFVAAALVIFVCCAGAT